MVVTNNQIVERIMRFGIESKCGIPPEKWWETATAQLIKEKQRYERQQNLKYFNTLEEWFNATTGTKYLLVRGEHSELLKVTDLTTLQNFKIVGWSSQEIPAVVVI